MAVLRLAVFAVLSVAAHVLAQSTVKESIALPFNWIQQGKPDPHHVLRLRIALPQQNFYELERHLYEVSDPDHERYGQHLTQDEVDELVKPHPDSLNVVTQWLSSHGVADDQLEYSTAKDWITVSVPVALAEKMLDTTYHVYTHATSGHSLVRTTEYRLPQHLHTHIEALQPTTSFALFRPHKTTFHFNDAQFSKTLLDTAPIIDQTTGSTVDASCNQTVTLNCLRQLYNAGNYTASANVGNSIGVTGYLGENANFADLKLFYADQNSKAVNASFNVVLVNNGVNSQNITDAGGEADLDVQFAFGLAFPVNATFFSTGGSPPFTPSTGTTDNTNEPYLDWLNFVMTQKHIPLSISTSYGDEEQTVPFDYASRVCKDFAKLGARGVSIMFSSGDGGVGDGDSDPSTTVCVSNDGKKTPKFLPAFPASCPYVTTVGGTIHIPETAVDFSGGGFSNYFPRPSYQSKAVSTFLKSLPNGTYTGLFNTTGRAYPDVSAQADNYRVFFQGSPVLIGGTSASCPAFNGFVAMLNDVRLKRRMRPLGFLNPLIYGKALSGFNDITTGNNPGCGTQGFNATKGWDPVTGVGTPNFGKLMSIVVQY